MIPRPHYCPHCGEHHNGMCIQEAGPLLADARVDLALAELTIADLRHKLTEAQMKKPRP